jgi:hypothetical protein
MQTWPAFLPMWAASYSGEYKPAVIRDTSLPGHVDQRLISHRVIETVNVSLELYGYQLPVFEYFMRDLCGEGADIFNANYRTENGIVSGKIRLEKGQYSVQFLTNKAYKVSATIELIS